MPSVVPSVVILHRELPESYTTTPDFHYAGATELEIKCSLSHLNATGGEVKVTVTYV